METSASTWSSMKWVRSFWTKGRHLSDLELVQSRLALGMPRGVQQSILRKEEVSKQLTEASALHVAYHEDILCPIVGDAFEPFNSAGRVPRLDVDVIGCLHRGQLPGRQLCP